jgi:hypothetical protein
LAEPSHTGQTQHQQSDDAEGMRRTESTTLEDVEASCSGQDRGDDTDLVWDVSGKISLPRNSAITAAPTATNRRGRWKQGLQ